MFPTPVGRLQTVCKVGVAGHSPRDGDAMVRVNVKTVVSTFGVLLMCLLFSGSAAAWVKNGVVVCDAPNNQLATQIVSDGFCGAIITWQDFRDGRWDIYAQKVDSSGAKLWTASGVAVCTGSGDQTSPRLISDGSGGAIIAWMDSRSDPSDIYAQRVDSDGIAQWEPGGVAICSAPGGQDSHDIAADGLGGATIAWSDLRGADRDLYAQRVDSERAPRWSPDGVPVCDTIGHQLVPQITNDTPGGWIVTWEDWRAGHPCYAQKMDSLGERQWVWQGVVVCSTYCLYPALATDDSGGAIVIWKDWRRGHEDLYAQRIDSSGAIRWTQNGVSIFLEQFPYGGFGGYEIVDDGWGGAFVICSYNLGTFAQCHVFACRLNSEGNKLWHVDVTYTGDEYNLFPQVVKDGSGGVVISWTWWPGLDVYCIYAQRIDSSGLQLWAPGGVVVCDTIATKSSVVMTSDGQSGAMLTWCDYRNGTDYNVYAQKVDSGGVVGVGESGVRSPESCVVRFSQNHPNPFSRMTDIRYQIADARSPVRTTLKVYDVAGKLVKTLVNREQDAGSYSVLWDGRDSQARRVAGGVYFYRLEAGGFSETRPMVLFR